MFIGKHLGEDFFDEFISLYLFLDFERKLFWFLSVKFLAGLSNCFVTCQEEYFWANLIFIYLFKLALGFEGNFFGQSAKWFRKGCQNCTLRVQNSFWRKLDFTFSDFGRKLFDSFLETAFLLYEWLFMGKVSFSQITTFKFVSDFDWNIYQFWRSILTGLSKALLYASNGSFEGIFLLVKNLIFSFVFGFWRIFLEVSKKISAWLSKRFSSSGEEQLDEFFQMKFI